MTRRSVSAGPAWVYRCYDADGGLIYVGSTTNLQARLLAHRSAWWSFRVVKVKAKVYRTIVEALAVERHSIRTERPRCNVMSKAADRSAWTRQDYVDYVLARSLAGSSYASNVVNHLQRIRGEYAARFNEPMPEVAFRPQIEASA